MKKITLLILSISILSVLSLFSCEEESNKLEINNDSRTSDLSVVIDTSLFDSIVDGSETGVSYNLISLQRTIDSIVVVVGFSGCSPDHQFDFVGKQSEELFELKYALLHKEPNELCEAYFTQRLSIANEDLDLSEDETLVLVNAFSSKEYQLPYGYPGLSQLTSVGVKVKETLCKPTQVWFEALEPGLINAGFERFSFLPMEIEPDLVLPENGTYSISFEILPWSVLANYTLCRAYEGEYLPVRILTIDSHEDIGSEFQVLELSRTENQMNISIGHSGCERDENFNFVFEESVESNEVTYSMTRLGEEQDCDAYFTHSVIRSLEELSVSDDETLVIINSSNQSRYYLPPNFPGLIQGRQIEVIAEKPVCQPTEYWFVTKNPSQISEGSEKFSFVPMEINESIELVENQEYLVSIEILPWSVYANYALCEMYEGDYLPVRVTRLEKKS